MAKIQISDFTFSEATSIVAGGKVTTDKMLPILAELDKIGLSSVEIMSAASFSHAVQTTYEDPWERIRRAKDVLKKTPLQIGFQGQNLFGRRNFPDDAVEYFMQKSIDNGVDVFRVFDPLNDTRNLETALRTASLADKKVIAGVIYTGVDSLKSEVFQLYAKQLEEMGASAISILDPAGILRPYDAYQLVKSLQATLSPTTSLSLHTYCKTDMGQMTALKAAEAGVNVIDSALSSFAMGSSLPSTETLINTFAETPYATELPTEPLNTASRLGRNLFAKLKKSGYILPEACETVPDNTSALIPADLTPFISDMLRDARIQNRMQDLCDEVARIRPEIGNIPLSSPVAEIVLAEAVFNLISEERYSTLTKEFKALVHGEFGRTPADIRPAFRNKICGNANGIDYRPADRMEPLIEKLREEVVNYAEAEEDVLTYAILGDKAKDFFETRKIQKYKLSPDADFVNKVHVV